MYQIKTQGENPPPQTAPHFIDSTGAYFRCAGGNSFICGRSPTPETEPSTDNLDVDHEFFDIEVWPRLAHRVPAFEAAKVISSWAGYYDYNTFDENGIIGKHPYYHNVFIVAGFSGHGIQQSPATGRAVSELMLDGEFKTLDLKRFGFEKLITQERRLEDNIV